MEAKLEEEARLAAEQAKNKARADAMARMEAARLALQKAQEAAAAAESDAKRVEQQATMSQSLASYLARRQ